MDSLSARTIVGRAAISSPALLPPPSLKSSVSFRSAAAPSLGRSAGARSAGAGRISCAAVSVSTPVGGTDSAVSSAAAAVASKPTVLVSEKLGEAGLEVLRGFANVNCEYNLSQEELCAKISLCDALIVRSGTKVTREVFEAAKGRLKVVGRAGVGIDNVDLQAATEFGCLVVNAPTANTVAAAEHGIALMAAMARNVAQADASMKAGEALHFPCHLSRRSFLCCPTLLTSVASLKDEIFVDLLRSVSFCRFFCDTFFCRTL